jgi:hypothetical protein
MGSLGRAGQTHTGDGRLQIGVLHGAGVGEQRHRHRHLPPLRKLLGNAILITVSSRCSRAALAAGPPTIHLQLRYPRLQLLHVITFPGAQGLLLGSCRAETHEL